jgi:hypothetical protein
VPEIKIRVGASVDQSLRTVFRPLVASAIDARKQILREFGQVPREIAENGRKIVRDHAQTYRGATAEARQAAREQRALARESAREQVSAAREAAKNEVELQRRAKREVAIATRLALAEMKREWRAYEREANRAATEAARAARKAAAEQERETRRRARATERIWRDQQREVERFAGRTSYHAARFATPHAPIASTARRVGSEVLRGIGIDTSISGAFQRNVTLERLATETSNSARLSGQMVSPSAIEDRVRDVSDKRGTSREDAAAGLLMFQKKTGDLGMGMEMLDKMVERSAATATNVEDFAGAMASASTQLGDMPNKAKVLLEIMDAVTVHGARGAVEVSDLATHFSRIAATASTFGGDRAENMKKLSALAQLSLAVGGAPTAAEAARSVTGFGNTFKKSARLKQFQEITGASAFADSGNTTLKDPIQLIKEALTGTGGDLNKMNKIFMDVVGARTVSGFTNAFNQAGGGDAGLAAVDKMMGKFMDNATLSQEMIDEALKQRENTTAVKVQRFQNTLDDVANELQVKLLPALEQLAPMAVQFVENMGELVAWSANNPGQAILAAILFSIGRAGIEQGVRAALERVIMAAGQTNPKGFMGALGAASVGAMIGVPVAAGIYTSGVAAATASMSREDAAARQVTEFRTAAKDPTKVNQKQREALRRKILDAQFDLDNMRADAADPYRSFGAWTTNLGRLAGTSNFDSEFRTKHSRLATMRAEMAKIDAVKPAETIDREGDGTIERWKANAGVSAEQLAQAAKGGPDALAKVATLVSKQDKAVENLAAIKDALKGTVKVEVQNFPEGGDGEAPTVDEGNRES